MSTAGVLDPMAAPADHRVLAVLRHGAVLAAEAGYYVFPVQQGEKVPARSNWETRATRSRRRLETWWQTTPYNPSRSAPSNLSYQRVLSKETLRQQRGGRFSDWSVA